MTPLLCVNIDHVATVRQARYRAGAGSGSGSPGAHSGGAADTRRVDTAEPDPVRAAHEAELGGADGITVHLREDRRHVGDRDVELLSRFVRVKFNLEMACTPEMVEFARRLRPHAPHTAMLVPEGRQEVTTEGGLDVAGGGARVRDAVRALKDAGIMVSVFIDADARQVEAAAKAGADVCEIHTGPYAHAFARCGGDFRDNALVEQTRRVRDAALMIVDASMRCNAGHALNYVNVGPVARMVSAANALGAARLGPSPTADRGELHIGHAIVSRAVFTGLRTAVADMKRAMREASESLSTESPGRTGEALGLPDLHDFGPGREAAPESPLGPLSPRGGLA